MIHSTRSFSLGLIAGIVSTLPAQQPAASPFPTAVEVLTPLIGQKDPQLGTFKKIRRGQPVAVNFRGLRAAHAGAVLRLRLFKDATFYARCVRKEKIECLADAFHWHCTLEGHAHSHCILTVVGDGFAAWLHPGLRTSTYLVQGAPGMHCARDMNDGGKGCGCDHNTRHHDTSKPAPQHACDDSTSTVTVMMVYSPLAQTQSGGQSKIQATCANGLAQCNTICRNSGVGYQYKATSIRYSGPKPPTTMPANLNLVSYTKGPRDPYGYMDWVPKYRKSEGADLVALIVGDFAGHGNTLGIAWQPSGQPSAGSGFSVTEYNSANNYTLAHELGHNFGCDHDYAQRGGTPPYSYGYGYNKNIYTSWPYKDYFRTTMSYRPSCPTGYSCRTFYVPIFSSPQLTVRTTRGNFAGGTSRAHNALLVRNTLQSVANHSWSVRGWRSTPKITKQPSARSLPQGYLAPNTAVMSVAADGATKYQWQKNGSNISGQTKAILTLGTNLSKADEGLYRCVVSGPCYSTTSMTARLTITSARKTYFYQSGTGTVVGDVNGDGNDDFVMTDPSYLSGKGFVQLRLGGSNSLQGSFTGFTTKSRFGTSVASGDVDGDGRADVLFGAPGDNAVFLIKGSSPRSYSYFLSQTTGVGTALATARYLDNDGHADVIIGAGAVIRAYSGRTKRLLHSFTAPANVTAIETVGDVNSDGHDDYAIGMPSWAQRGRVEIRSGKDGKLLRVSIGQGGWKFGQTLAATGDITGDRVPDLVVGATGYSYAGARGAVCTISGSNGSLIRLQPSGYYFFGTTLASGFDHDGDGKLDVVIGAYGGAFVYSPARSVFLKVISKPSGVGASFGMSASAGYLNGDGTPDYVIGGGGSTELIVFDATPVANPAEVKMYGRICADSKGRLARAGHSIQPRVGGKTELRLDSAPPSSMVFFHLGQQRQNVDLGILRMPGCAWHVRPLIEAALATDSKGRVRLPGTVPSTGSLVGARLQFQFFPVDRGLPTSRTQATASNGVEVRIGAK